MAAQLRGVLQVREAGAGHQLRRIDARLHHRLDGRHPLVHADGQRLARRAEGRERRAAGVEHAPGMLDIEVHRDRQILLERGEIGADEAR